MSETTERPRLWSVGGRSVIGANHIRYRVPNQDAIAWSPREGNSQTAVLALSDGHGASMHYRSGTGAHIAVEVAVAALSEALADPAWIARADTAAAQRIVRDILARWRSEVVGDIAARPLEMPAESYEDRFLPYGATIVAAAIAPEGAFAMQLGDGDLMIGRADGLVYRPLPSDALQGEQTYSLCLPDAEERTRFAIFPASRDDIDFAMLSTDGLAKSFASEAAFARHAASWRMLLAGHGFAAVADKLDDWLAGATRYGVGDDITLGFIARQREQGASGLVDFALTAPEGMKPPEKTPPIAYGLTILGAALCAAAGFLLTRWR